MTITVNALESGTHKFPSADKLQVDPDGRLWVGRGEKTEAIFNAKEWLAVVAEVITEPRVWQLVSEIPAGVEFSDADDDLDKGSHFYRSTDRAYWLNDYAPFTEVLDK